LYHHSVIITAKVHKGRNTMGLLPTNHMNRVTAPGSLRMPFGIKMSMVIPPRIGNGLLVSNETSEPRTSAVAPRSAEPYAPVNAWARSEPAAESGKLTSAEAWSIGTGQSLPVTFQ
jgi:hypothetical protein